MFSGLGVADFSIPKARASENVLDVLQRTGVKVKWVDNNSGCKGVCARVPTRQIPASGDAKLCADGSCYDEILIQELSAELKDINQDSAIILHQMGSHGPSYYKRYPSPGKYVPTCDTNRIQNCDRQSLINTYDNTISYTSEVIAMAIAASREHEQNFDIAVMYISDHGESLGERNVYLHGLPLILAPQEQLKVPMMAWLPSSTQSTLGLSSDCISSLASREHSHDNLPHTLLGFFGVQTTFYRSDLDIFEASRGSGLCSKTS
jgi:lipid A ethanolaminephosphotransferase